MSNRCALAAGVVAALAVGGVAAATPATAQMGPYGPYHDYAPGYSPGPGLPWGSVIANSNHSVPFNPLDAAESYRYGRNYGYCGFTITGC
jgi:hypothetical protein